MNQRTPGRVYSHGALWFASLWGRQNKSMCWCQAYLRDLKVELLPVVVVAHACPSRPPLPSQRGQQHHGAPREMFHPMDGPLSSFPIKQVSLYFGTCRLVYAQPWQAPSPRTQPAARRYSPAAMTWTRPSVDPSATPPRATATPPRSRRPPQRIKAAAVRRRARAWRRRRRRGTRRRSKRSTSFGATPLGRRPPCATRGVREGVARDAFIVDARVELPTCLYVLWLYVAANKL